ncbi:MAG: hypothetical protein WBP93_15430 [Pyrinomonadaceae bacterium]
MAYAGVTKRIDLPKLVIYHPIYYPLSAVDDSPALRQHIEACLRRRIRQPYIATHEKSSARLLFTPDKRRGKLK